MADYTGYYDSPDYDTSMRDVLANMVRSFKKPENWQAVQQGMQNVANVAPSVAESLARGGIAQVPGTFGDVSQLARTVAPQTMNQVFGQRSLPTTEEILAKVPRYTPNYEGSQQHEMVGEVTGPALAKMLKMGVEATKGMPVGNMIENVDKFKIAQQNAALPIEQGGLGLPPNNTALDRAKAMGYETPVYHGTNADINAFNVEGKGKTSGAGAFFTTNPTTAETYVSASGGGNIIPSLLKKDDFLIANAKGRNWADIWTDQLAAKSKGKKYNLDDLELDKNSATSTDELGMIAKELGLKGVQIKNVKDLGPNSHVMRAKEYLLEKYGIVPDETWSNVTGKQFYEAQKAMKKFYESQKSDIYAIQDPSLIRSRFAAFDPKRIKEADILAGVAPLTLKEQLEEQFNKLKK